ncbi:hypothetical protein [Paraburkholderia sp. ZP32-5]|uniref:hypothetical protein n=1 Tax=Paraburkholderia sp. ZP32-5 TaxID=2883245 RepID=UPI001F2E161B|nr:hypothetical protein [Paraburkholderia sp. ZP32-5]
MSVLHESVNDLLQALIVRVAHCLQYIFGNRVASTILSRSDKSIIPISVPFRTRPTTALQKCGAERRYQDN